MTKSPILAALLLTAAVCAARAEEPGHAHGHGRHAMPGMGAPKAGDTPATYRQIATALDTTPQTVRTCLDGLRARLSDLDGIPGLRLDEDGDGPATASYLAALAHWAVDTGQVALADVHAGAAR